MCACLAMRAYHAPRVIRCAHCAHCTHSLRASRPLKRTSLHTFAMPKQKAYGCCAWLTLRAYRAPRVIRCVHCAHYTHSLRASRGTTVNVCAPAKRTSRALRPEKQRHTGVRVPLAIRPPRLWLWWWSVVVVVGDTAGHVLTGPGRRDGDGARWCPADVRPGRVGVGIAVDERLAES